MTGRLFDIERFSTEDGPGIRTAVFFKGCNLHCPWCHNPEGIHRTYDLLFAPARCIGCGRCMTVCPNTAHMIRDGRHVLLREKCTGCMACTKVCFSGALEQSGWEVTVSELMDELLQDQIFWTNSNGGVTLTGGEVMCQASFASTLLHQLHSKQVHTAVETSLSLPSKTCAPVLEACDLVLADLKHIDSTAHREAIGTGNETVLENLHSLNKPLILRTPIIPGFNDDRETIANIAAFAAGLTTLLYYDLLPYHSLGNHKNELLGRQSVTYETPTAEHMYDLAATAKHKRIEVRINGKRLPGE